MSLRFLDNVAEMAFDLGMPSTSDPRDIYDRIRLKAEELTHAKEAWFVKWKEMEMLGKLGLVFQISYFNVKDPVCGMGFSIWRPTN